MDFEHNNGDGSDNFWPGYVDAVTNLVLNLLFLLTIMTVAVFMFALELGRASLGGAGQTPQQTVRPETEKTAKTLDPVSQREETVKELQKQVQSLASEKDDPDKIRRKADSINKALSQEIRYLESLRAQQNRQSASTTIVPATKELPKPPKNLARIIVTDAEVAVVFTEEAVKLTPPEHIQLRDALKRIAAGSGARIVVDVPAGFTEARRLGFYRAMEVRNKLIEMKMAPDKIDVSVKAGSARSNASIVKVSPR